MSKIIVVFVVTWELQTLGIADRNHSVYPAVSSIGISFHTVLLMEPFAVPNSHVKVALKISDFDGIKVHDQTTIVSSFAYMAPEVLVSQWFTKASDVWR